MPGTVAALAAHRQERGSKQQGLAHTSTHVLTLQCLKVGKQTPGGWGRPTSEWIEMKQQTWTASVFPKQACWHSHNSLLAYHRQGSLPSSFTPSSMPACLPSPLVLYPELHCADGAHRRTFVMKTANRSTANRCAGVNRSQWSRSAQKERESPSLPLARKWATTVTVSPFSAHSLRPIRHNHLLLAGSPLLLLHFLLTLRTYRFRCTGIAFRRMSTCAQSVLNLMLISLSCGATQKKTSNLQHAVMG